MPQHFEMAEMEKNASIDAKEVARLTAENEELKALLAARDAEIAQLKRNLKLAHKMMKESELEDVNSGRKRTSSRSTARLARSIRK